MSVATENSPGPLLFGQSPLPACPEPPAESVPAATLEPGNGGRLWLCLYLPQLPLEIPAGNAGAPRVVLDRAGRRPTVLLCDAVACRHGVRPGMPVNAALALLPQLETRVRQPALEREALGRLAAWATGFTPSVSLDPHGALLLEIGGSAGLFGGAAGLRATAVAALTQRGHVVWSAIAPTARAAFWLASSGEQRVVTEAALLPGVLARLPLRLPGWAEEIRQRLRRMGVTRLGECLRLPRDGLARRIGPDCLVEIDEALGRRPELRQMIRHEDGFRGELDLPVETRDSASLIEALRILLRRLEAHLRQRQAGARVLWMRLHHGVAPATLLRIGLLRPSADAGHLEELAAIRLATLVLPAPVVSIRLEAEVAPWVAAAGSDLFGRPLDPDERLTGLVERLRMRLGQEAVHGIRSCDEHRPEAAWRVVSDLRERCPPVGAGISRGTSRPLWLLESPLALAARAGTPFFHGQVRFESGPERIETGWWDGRDIRRDYHVACNPRGLRLWIFRDLRGGSWYLHGLFG